MEVIRTPTDSPTNSYSNLSHFSANRARSEDDVRINVSPMISRVASDSTIVKENRSVEHLSRQLLFKEEKLQQAALYGMSLYNQLEEEHEQCEKFKQLYDTIVVEHKNVKAKLEEARNKQREQKRALIEEIESLTEKLSILENQNRKLKSTPKASDNNGKKIDINHMMEKAKSEQEKASKKAQQDLMQKQMELEAKSKLQIARIKKKCNEDIEAAREQCQRVTDLLTEERENHNILVDKLQHQIEILQTELERQRANKDYCLLYDKIRQELNNERKEKGVIMEKLQEVEISLLDALDNNPPASQIELEQLRTSLKAEKQQNAAILQSKQELELSMEEIINSHHPINNTSNNKANLIDNNNNNNHIHYDTKDVVNERARTTIRTMRHQIRSLVQELEQTRDHIILLKEEHMRSELELEDMLTKRLNADKENIIITDDDCDNLTTSSPSLSVRKLHRTTSRELYAKDPIDTVFQLLQFIRHHPKVAFLSNIRR